MQELDQDEITKLLQGFQCNLNTDVESFLTQPSKAIRFEQTDNARTYLVLDESTGDILGYFSVTFKELSLESTALSKTQVKKMDGISKNAERIRAFLIGQIGKNTAIPNNPIKLKDLLSETYAVLTEAKALVGGRLIILECENTPKLIELYQQHDFTLIELAGDTKPELRTLYIHAVT